MEPLSPERLALLRIALAAQGLTVPAAQPLPRRADAARAPLSLAQERLFFLELYRPGTAVHNDALLVLVDGELDPARLARALDELQRRHESLRTTFALVFEGPEQRIDADPRVPLRTLDLRDADRPAARARALADEDARSPFDLAVAPPWRATLYRTAEHGWQLALCMHHLVTDGASMGVLLDELAALYAGRTLAPLAVQYGDYAAWERARHATTPAEDVLAHWRAVLARPLPPLDWTDAVGAPSGQGMLVPLAFADGAGARVATCARENGATSSQVLLAAWLALLAAASGADDVRTGLAASLRGRRELDPLVGFLVQSLLMRVDLSGNPDARELLRRARSGALDAQAHAAVPLDRLLRMAQPRGAELLPAFFSHMRAAIRAPVLGDARTRWEFLDPGCARFELALVVHEGEDGLTGALELDLGRFARESGPRLAAAYVALVEAIVARPAVRLAELCAAASARLVRPRRASEDAA
jgi:hypothetical protein